MHKKLLLTSILATSVLLAGCSDDDDNPATEYSYVRVLHAVPSAPNVDVVVDGSTVAENVAYQQGSDYLRVTPGTREIELIPTGSDSVALSEELTLAANSYYSVLVQNGEGLALNVLDDTSRVKNGTTDVTVVHAAGGVGNVDIYVTAPDVDLPEEAALGAVPFGDDDTLPNVATGNYQVRVTGADSRDVVYDSGALAISRDLYAVAVDSVAGASPATLLIWTNTVTPVLDNSAEVRIVHAVDAVDVDVFAGGAELLSDFGFKDTTVGVPATVKGYLKVPAGNLAVAIAPANAGIESALDTLSSTLTLARGESYTVIAAGDVNNLAETQLIVLNDVRTGNDSAQVRLVHAASAPEADPVDIYVTTEGGDISGTEPNFNDVVIGQNTEYVSLDAGTYDVIIAAGGTQTAAVPNTSGLELAAGSVTTAIAVGNSVGTLDRVILDDAR